MTSGSDYTPGATRNLEKRIVSLNVNPQFSKSVGELVLDLIVNPQLSNSVGESQIGDFASSLEIVKSRRSECLLIKHMLCNDGQNARI